MQTTELTVVLRARAGERIADLAPFLKVGSTVAVGRSGAVVTAVSAGDKITHAERLESQVVLAEAAMRRGALMHDQDHLPALRRVIDHVPAMYLQVADAVKQAALEDGDDLDAAEEAAGQAIRVLVMFKQRLEKLLEPDLLTATSVAISEPEPVVVAETPYAQVRVTDIGEWIRTVANAKRYEWLRDKNRVEDMDTDLCAAREEQCFFGAELDTEVDTGMRLERLLEKHGEPV
ncbi:hypothetical protein [Pseudomonas petrae]|uniref:hypothetical protein n=1 Tax=Pseudomonas petrae TaxID=2912190 RepID=UPI001F219164|nr:hypothetical protein [Pseudomonas petrae]MCF7532001.1 hypothetical protein [Pseudomonas petrae]